MLKRGFHFKRVRANKTIPKYKEKNPQHHDKVVLKVLTHPKIGYTAGAKNSTTTFGTAPYSFKMLRLNGP
jgi:hypothetical protein